MTNQLFPAAQAVLTAVTQQEYSLNPSDIPNEAARISCLVAAALRAAADHVETVAPWVGHTESAGVHWSICELKSIAAELDSNQTI